MNESFFITECPKCKHHIMHEIDEEAICPFCEKDRYQQVFAGRLPPEWWDEQERKK